MPARRPEKSKDVFPVRKQGKKQSNSTFLILCEGKQTEPNYFNALKRKQRWASVTVRGIGEGALRVVKEAVKEKDKFDEVWCVFDRDDIPRRQFDSALRLAEEHGIHIAYSIWCFELWLVLHFEFLKDGIERKRYETRLSEYLAFPYSKNCSRMVAAVIDRVDIAMKHAAQLASQNNTSQPFDAVPSTKVHLLIAALRKGIRNR